MHLCSAHGDRMTNQASTTLILGGTGKTGRRVAQRLTARGHAVRIGSRSGTPAFDWSDPRTWSEALLDGVGALYIAYYPDLAYPGAAAQIRGFVERAVRRGVRRIVLLSGRGEPQVLPSEEAVRTSGAAFTILRAAVMAQNFSEAFLVDGVLAGEIAFPAGSVAEPFIDVDDVADVAVAALTDARHAGMTYDLTGPRLVTFREAAATLAAALARPIVYRPVSFEDYAVALAPYLPPEHVAFLVELFRHIFDGHNAQLGDGVERALGRAPRDFRDYVRDAAAAGAWDQVA